MRATLIGLAISVLAFGACDRSAPATSAQAADQSSAVGTAGSGVREFTLPPGTLLHVVLDTSVGSDTSQPEDAVRAHLQQPVIEDSVTVLPEGSRVGGVVTSAVRSGKVKGLAHVAMRFDSIAPRNEAERYQMQTQAVGRTAPATKKKDALEIGGGAAGGALIGALIGGGKGAAIGAGVGAGAGTAVVLSTRGKEIHVPAGAPLSLRLTEPLTVRVGG
jgi:hypothetical protein